MRFSDCSSDVCSSDLVEAYKLFSRGAGWVWLTVKMLLKYWFDIGWRMKTPRDRRQVLGQGMVATLRYAMQQQHIPLQLDTGMESLIEQDGRVVGVVVEHNGKTLRYQAKHGELLA